MAIAALILSVMALLMSGASLVLLLARKFSTHVIQPMPVDFMGVDKNGLGLEDFELDEDPEFNEKKH